MRGRGSKKSGGKSAVWFLVPFGSIFLLAGLFAFNALFIKPLRLMRAAQSWPAVPAEVVSSQVRSSSTSDGTTYRAEIVCRYEVSGRSYTGERYDAFGVSTSSYKKWAAVVREYPPGKKVTVYVNPADPSESLLNREGGPMLLIGLFPLIFVLVGAGVMAGGIVGTARSHRKWKPEPAGIADGPQELKSTVTPQAKAFGISAVALFWNGMVFGFLFRSDAPFFFKLIFAAVGVLIAAGAVHAILALLNPRPQLRLHTCRIYPGSEVQLDWTLSGRAERLERMTLSLQGRESAWVTRRSGGKSETRKEHRLFFDEPVYEVTGAESLRQGCLRFRIPADAVPSFKGGRFEIRWQLKVRGEIARWPDVNQEFVFKVYAPGGVS